MSALKGLVLGGLVVLVLLITCIYLLPQTIQRSRRPKDLEDIEGLTGKDRIQLADDSRKLQNDIRTALLQGFAGAALVVGLLVTWHQQQAELRRVNDQLTVARQDARTAEHNARTAEQGLVTERFKDGVEELGSPDENVQAGGIFTLARVKRDSPSDADNVNEVILFFVRGHLCDNPTHGLKGKPALLDGPPKSVVAGLQVLPRSSGHRIDLRGLSCQDAHIQPKREVDLTDVDLTGAFLSGARLEGANFTNARISGATIMGTDFDGANLSDTDLTGAKGFKQDQLAKVHWLPGHPPHVDPDKKRWLRPVHCRIGLCRISILSTWSVSQSASDSLLPGCVVSSERSGFPSASEGWISVSRWTWISTARHGHGSSSMPPVSSR